MTDILTSWDAASGHGDWLFDPDQAALPGSSELATAVLISLFSDATASGDDALPDPDGGKRGWWGGAIGSKLWLRQRAKQTPTLLAQVKGDIEAALAWMIADGLAGSIDVTTEYTRPGMLGASVVIHRANGTDLSLRFANFWDAN